MTTLPTDPTTPARPHPISNDLTHEQLSAPVSREERRIERDAAVPRKERRVLGHLGMFIGGAVLLGIIVAAFLYPRPEMFFVGVVFVVAYGLMLAAPVILADTTKVAQDESVRAKSGPTDISAGH